MSAGAERDAAALAWLCRQLAAVRRWSMLSIVAGVTASLSYAAFAYLIAAGANAWIAGNAISPSTPWLALAAVLARGICHALRDWAGARAAIVVRANARAEVLDALERLGPLRARLGDDGALATLAIEQVDALDGYVARYTPQRVVAVLVPLALIALVLPHSWLAASILFVTAPLIPLFMMLVGYGAAAASREQADALARLGGRFLDLVRGLPALRTLGAAHVGAQRLADGAHEYRERMLRVLRLAFLSSSVLEFFASAAIAMVALYLGLALLGRFDTGHYGAIDLGSALFILLLAPEFYAPLRQLGADYHARADALVAADRIGEATRAAPAVVVAASEDTVPDADAPLIEFDAVTLRHADGRVALDNISFRIARGERVALRGASGAGKSSVLALLAGFVTPTSGTIRINGVNLAQIERAAWWRRLGWLEQRPEWFRRSIADNVLLGDADTSRLWPALERAELADVVRALPRGAESVVGEADGSMSGGQLQRLALARALARDADVWLLDEPTAHLDAETAERLVATLGEASSFSSSSRRRPGCAGMDAEANIRAANGPEGVSRGCGESSSSSLAANSERENLPSIFDDDEAFNPSPSSQRKLGSSSCAEDLPQELNPSETYSSSSRRRPGSSSSAEEVPHTGNAHSNSIESSNLGTTVLLATHAETPAWIDRILTLAHGRIHDDVRRTP